MQRRAILGFLATSAAAFMFAGKSRAENTVFPVRMSDDEWRKKLSPDAYRVLREEGTESPNSSALLNEHRKGVFTCAGCDTKLFSSDAKFESGTGWPSFFQPINDKAIGTTTDHKLIISRTEVHCDTCGGHLGHVFEDGPKPTGLRYCMNGVAMKFIPDKA